MRRGRRLTTAERLILTLTAAVSVVLLVTGVVTILVISGFVHQQVSNRLIDTSARIRASLVGLPDLDITSATITDIAKSGSAVVVVIEDGQPVMWMNGDALTAQLAVASAQGDGQPHDVAGSSDLRAIRLDTAGSGLTVTEGQRRVTATALVVAISTTQETAATRTLALVSGAGILAAIVTLVVLTMIIVGRGLRPLREMSERAEAYADGDRAVRLPESVTDSDMARLATTLNQALDAQQEAEQRLRSFVADASHELRTPLTTATGWIELYLQGGLTDPERRDHAMERAQLQLSRMRVLIDELALLARLDRARPLTLGAVDLTGVATDVLEDARLRHPDRSFTLHAAGPATLQADGPRLHQVVANLVGNAVQHTPPGTPVEVTVTPASTAHPSQPPVHTLLVTDHGPGIPTQEQPHIFERFWRGDSSRDRQTGGSGLGLAIVASIVQAHGGSSEVVSTAGQGATIKVTLPLDPPDR